MKFQNEVLNLGFQREIKTIENLVMSLAVNENKLNFYNTMMYLDDVPESYENTSGKFIKNYFKVGRYCGDNNGDCFADKYYIYSGNNKIFYTPSYKGACASLKNGMSLCLTPQIGAVQISGIIDLNGKKGPNVLDRDLRYFTINSKAIRTGHDTTSTEVLTHENPNITTGGSGGGSDPCVEDNNSLACCNKRKISGPEDACCTYDSIKTSSSSCHSHGTVRVKVEPTNCTTTICNFTDAKVTVELRPATLEPSLLFLTIQFGYWGYGGSSRCANGGMCFLIDDEGIEHLISFTKQGDKLIGSTTIAKFPGMVEGIWPIGYELNYGDKSNYYTTDYIDGSIDGIHVESASQFMHLPGAQSLLEW